MKVYAFTDLHGNTKALTSLKRRAREEQPEVILCSGDLTVFEHELEPLLSRLQLLKVPVLIIHGNHESAARMAKACKKYSRITFLHQQVVELGGYLFAGFGGGGFQDEYPDLEDLMKQWRALDWSRLVFLSHAPPYKTLLDDVSEEGEEEWHVGSKTLRSLIQKYQPLLVLTGHIHERFHATDLLGLTRCENPGPIGTLYDLDKLQNERRVAERERQGRRVQGRRVVERERQGRRVQGRRVKD